MIKWIKTVFNRGQPKNAMVGPGTEGLMDFFKGLGLDIDSVESSSELSEVIYFICIKHLSETMSKMPWYLLKESEEGKEKPKNFELTNLLNLRPNRFYTASTLWASVELNKLHHGNAFVYIERKGRKIYNLWVLPSQDVKIWVDSKGIWGSKNLIWYEWNDSKSGKTYKFFEEEILHFKTSTSFNGYSGIPIKDLLLTQINSNKHSQAFLNKLYKNNMFGSKVIVNYTGDLNAAKEKKLASKLETFSSSQGSGKFIPLPLGMEVKLLDMKLADAQFFENNKVSALQIAAAFGIKPNIINNYDKSSYSNSESQQLDFYVNTLLPLFNNYQQELSYKLLSKKERDSGISLVIDEKILFKMDNETKSSVYSRYVNSFIMTPNEVRDELNLPSKEGGDQLIGNGSNIGIEDLGNQYNGGE